MGDMLAFVDRHRSVAASAVAELFMRASLPDLGETEFDENCDDFTGLENGSVAHNLSYSDVLDPHEF